MEEFNDALLVQTSARPSDTIVVLDNNVTNSANGKEVSVCIQTGEGYHVSDNQNEPKKYRIAWKRKHGDQRLWTGTPGDQILWLQKILESNGIASPPELDKAEEMWRNRTEDLPLFDLIMGKAQDRVAALLLKPDAEYGLKFKTSKRGSGKMSTLLDQELKNILMEVGSEATCTEIMYHIEELAENFHPVFQDVDREKERIYFKDPERRDHEEYRTFKTVKNRITDLKKNIPNKK
jgi:hypothetical protein